MSQVLLSFGIALALVPLLIFTSDSELMGDLVNANA
ncbi:divalent metal cation transporter [Escherichia coli]